MFNRTYIKDMAKARLNGGSGNAILVLFLAGLFGGISGSFWNSGLEARSTWIWDISSCLPGFWRYSAPFSLCCLS